MRNQVRTSEGTTRVLTAICAVLATLGCVQAPVERPRHATIATYSAQDEALYTQRFEAMMSGGSIAIYDTLEPVRGATSPDAIAIAADTSFSAEAAKRAIDYVAARNTSAFIVWRDGAIEIERYFGEFDRDEPIVSKSLAKPVTALLIGRAIEQGHIRSLDQPVADFITEWRGDAGREKILVRHLIEMRSGLLPQTFASDPADILNRSYLHPRHDEIIIGEYPLAHVPGQRFEYSNATAELVAPVIERATGRRYAEYLSEALLEPIGAAGGSVWVNREGGMAHSGCCLLLPAQSWLRMAILLLDDGVWQGRRLLPVGYAEAMKTATPQNPHYGMGVWVAGPYLERRGYGHPDYSYGKVLHSEPYADKDLYLFDGNSNQVVYIVPSQRMIILRTGASPPQDREWDNPSLPNLLIADLDRDKPTPSAEPQPR